MRRFALGIDVGAETLAVALLRQDEVGAHIEYTSARPHHQAPQDALRTVFDEMGEIELQGVAVTGRLQECFQGLAVPSKAALRRGLQLIRPELDSATILSIGAHGFCVLELQEGGQEWFQQNSRCSQGTGNFLGQLVKRFGLTVEEASALCDLEEKPASLSGRCPVILKTDMTHLANKGESQAAILAGLYDAVCENVLTLVRSRLAPRDVVLLGGVARSERIRRTVGAWLAERDLRLQPRNAYDEVQEALGAAAFALEDAKPLVVTQASELFAITHGASLERVPALSASLHRVHRMPPLKPAAVGKGGAEALLGFDIGSTGSKAVAIARKDGALLWEAYLNTEGKPVHAAQALMQRFKDEMGGKLRLMGVGATGSGREVVGSLLRTCYGETRVFVLNEIAAHARGAAFLDPTVDTIFEIGGQDAKYIRLEEGRVIDAAMNEACSAGTGSFIAEQGGKFERFGGHPAQLGKVAIEASEGISLGQHCSVFMAEVIDQAIAQGIAHDSIVAGLYDSVIQNYLNRVKGPRSVGERIFCQGMPFASDALAAAVARQTGREVVVPPNPGTIGALGIGLLSRDELPQLAMEPLDPKRFLEAEVKAKETFQCRSTKGCGGSGNKCRIDRLRTMVEGVEQKFLWGGNCSLYDRGTGRSKLPDLAPDPFREREALLDDYLSPGDGPGPVIGITDEFALRGLAPLFAVFLKDLGCRLDVLRNAKGEHLRRGIEGARVPFCAPVQLYHGVFLDLAERSVNFLLVPALKQLPRVAGEEYGVLCPLVIASPDLIAGVLPETAPPMLRPVVEFDEQGYGGETARRMLRELAERVGNAAGFERAYERAVAAQLSFDEECVRIGRDALSFCKEREVVPVAVLGRPYTIYNDVLNSNVPSILRSLGAMAIPSDCLPLGSDAPVFHNQYWSYTQRNLRATDFVRKTPGLYSVFCSNYACGPDSFTLQFFAYMMKGKPFAVVETDGHSGDAGTKTRMEAFLYCVDTDRKSGASDRNEPTDFLALSRMDSSVLAAKEEGRKVFFPRMGYNAEVVAAVLRGEGFDAEALPMSTREDVRMGRKHTSGKECAPMMMTLGTLLNRMEEERDNDRQFTFFMPTANGPCRFGTYNSLHKIVLERTGWADRVKVMSPGDDNYFQGLSPDFTIRVWLGFLVHDLLEMLLHDVRPQELSAGLAQRTYDRYCQELVSLMERPAKGGVMRALLELAGGIFGLRDLLERATADFAAARRAGPPPPTVSVVGEIYARLDPFTNDSLVEKLEARGLRVRFAPFIEWLEYTSYVGEERIAQGRKSRGDNATEVTLTSLIQRVTQDVLYGTVAKGLGWAPRVSVEDTVRAAAPYINSALTGEAVLSLGGPLREFELGHVDGVVMIGPHECMPCKIAEAQFGRAAEDVGIPYLSLSVNGDPLDTEALDRFAFDLLERRRSGARRHLPVTLAPPVSGRVGCGDCAGSCGNETSAAQ